MVDKRGLAVADIKNSLGILYAIIELMVRQAKNDPKAESYLETADKALKKICELLESLK
jgi:hypothetical protein